MVKPYASHSNLGLERGSSDFSLVIPSLVIQNVDVFDHRNGNFHKESYDIFGWMVPSGKLT